VKHPTYAADDVKAGQPVLVGDEFWSKPASGPLSGPFVADGMNESGVGCGMLRCLSHGNSFYSRPPEPKIEACVCGSTPMVKTCHRVKCLKCHRSGPQSIDDAFAIASWNADMRKMKAAGPRITQISLPRDAVGVTVCYSTPSGTHQDFVPLRDAPRRFGDPKMIQETPKRPGRGKRGKEREWP